MPSRASATLLGAILALAGCAGQESLDARLDARMAPLVGRDEAALVAALQRPPDTRTDLAAGGRELRWRWRQSYALPPSLLAYRYAGGSYQPALPYTGTGLVADDCALDWTLERGVATTYRWQGAGCAAAAETLDPGAAPK